MEDLNREIKNRNFLLFAAIASILLTIAIFIFFLYSFNKNAPKNPNQAMPAIEKKSAFDSLSAPATDSSGKPTSKNYLQDLSSPIPVVSPFPAVKNKKSSAAKIIETPKSYINYLPAPTN